MYFNSDCSSFFPTFGGWGFSPQPVPRRSACVRRGPDARRTAPRQIAVPRSGAFPNFDTVFELASTAAHIGQRVATLCMREQILYDWERRLTTRAIATPQLELLDVYSASPTDWAGFFARHAYDVTIFHGIGSALAARHLSLSHARQLVNAIPTGLIVLA